MSRGHGKGERKRRKQNVPIKDLELSMVSLLTREEGNRRKDYFLPGHVTESDKSQESFPSIDEDLPLSIHAVGIGNNSNYIGQEFSGITDRISKLLSDYEDMYIDKDQQGYAMMQEQLSGQFAMESLLSDYKSLCREREDLLNSLQDSLDMDEEDILDELEHMNRENLQSVDMEGAQQAIQDTLRNIKSTTDKLQDMNKQMVTLTQKGERNEKLEEEKRQLERELKMYKKAAVQQRKEMFSRRSSIRKDQTQQWKLVAGEMVDMLNMVRNAGNLDRETLEQELNRILMTLNTQTECIDNLKRDLSKQEKAYKNLEKDKNRLNDDKTLVEDQLRAKQQELKQCKQISRKGAADYQSRQREGILYYNVSLNVAEAKTKYLRKVMAERKDSGEEKIKTAEDEIHLTESAEEVIPEDALTTDILKAQVRDARKLVLKLEEENKELQRKLAALSSSSEENEEVQRTLFVHQESAESGTLEPNTEPASTIVVDSDVEASGHKCPRCQSYKEQIANQLQGFKSKEELIERLKRDLKKLRTLLISIKDTSNVQSELAMIEEVKEERFEGPGSPEIKVSEDVSTELQLSSENESSEDEAKEIQKPKKTGKVTTSAEGESKKLPGKSSRKGKSKKAAKLKQKGKEDQSEKGVEKDNEEDKEEKAIDMDKDEDKGKAKKPKKKEGKGAGYKPKRVLVGECREEKAPYVKVREARMVTLANKGTQTSHYDHLAESTTRRNATEWQPLGRRKPLAETIMAGVTPSEMQEETRAASLFIKEQADRLCDEISSFVECGYSLIEQGAKTTRMMIDTHLGQNAAEMLENDDPALQLEIAKEIKALQSCSHRRQSFFANKRRRSSVNLERRGTRRHSKLPFFDGLRRESRADSVTGQENTRKELEAESVSSNKELEVGSVTEQSQSPDGSKKESPDQQTSGEVDQYSKESETRARSRALSISTQGSFAINQPVFDSTFVNNSPWSTLQNFADSLTSYTGAACSHVVNSVRLVVEGSGMIPTEEQVKEQVKITAQHAIDTIQSTAEILNNQLQAEAGVYEKFFALWSDIKEKKETSPRIQEFDKTDDPKKILTKVDERDFGFHNIKDAALLPPLDTQGMGARVTIAPATAQLSQKGMMIIQGAGNKPTEVIPPPPPSYGKMKKRGKLANHSRRQMLHKQKAVMDKMLNVNHRIEDLHHLLNEMGEQMSSGAGDAGVSLNISQATKQTRPSYQGIPLTMSQDFYLPLMARSVGLPAIPQGLQIQGAFDHQPTRTEDAKKKVGPAEPAKERANEQETPKLPGMNMANALWQRKNSVAKFSSQNVIRKSFSEHEAKFPLLNISHILKVGQGE